MKPPLLVIAGPTGVGKTAAAVALARLVPLEVVNADSRQVYRGMDAATGKPSLEERRAVPHHLVDVVDPDDRYHAARFVGDARAAIAGIRARGALPAVVGGTGLYVRALLRGLDPASPADPAYRRELYAVADRDGSGALHARLVAVAPSVARRLHPNDHVRIVRALERLRSGDALVEERWRRRDGDDHVIYVGLTLERSRLAARLRERAAAFVASGLADEVRRLLARGYDPTLPAMQGIGYREFVRVVSGGALDERTALRFMQRDTVRYAKRQWTWFMREPEIQWLDVEFAGGADGVATLIEHRLRRGGAIA
ncbi:MAG: tRNA (adenosine(37)-N6)-dimethylallyltransferase MiaA [Candidatus Rokubacteria bacterium]|nr:tRNA (adenosine(37)-N6)-dimethylallyltransferase MiaA [Candidatus Rokubacteria bacterium]